MIKWEHWLNLVDIGHVLGALCLSHTGRCRLKLFILPFMFKFGGKKNNIY